MRNSLKRGARAWRFVEERLAERRQEDRGQASGELRIEGHVRLAGNTEGGRVGMSLAIAVGTPSDRVARSLAAFAHPVRIDILKALVDGPKESQALLTAAGLNTTGQLYHHLRAMTAAGVIEQRGRNFWALRHLPEVFTAFMVARNLAD